MENNTYNNCTRKNPFTSNNMTHSHDGGKSLGLLLVSLFLRAYSEVRPMDRLTNMMTIIALTLTIAYHILGIRERVLNLKKRNRLK